MYLAHMRFRIYMILLSLGLCLGGAGCAGTRPKQVSVLFFNDTHGYLAPFKVERNGKRTEAGGFARLAGAAKWVKSQNEKEGIPTVLLCAGDILQGTPVSTVFKGRADIDCMNAMGVDAMCVGNHEFDFGTENFQELMKRAKFPFLSANIDLKAHSGTAALCRAAADIDLGGGIRLTVVGATTRNLLVTTAPWNVSGLTVREPVKSVVDTLRDRDPSGPVLVLSHCERGTDMALAAKAPGITAVISGHDHLLLSPPPQVNGVPVLQALEKGRYLGRLDIGLGAEAGEEKILGFSYIPIAPGAPVDPKVAKIVAKYNARLGDGFREVIGTANVDLRAERGRIRYREAALGNFIADAVREHTGADIALVNGGGIRAGISKGEITVGDVFQTMPFANEVIVLTLTGEQVRHVLTLSASCTREDEFGGFLHVSGLRFVINGKRPSDIRIGTDSRPLQNAATYTVAVPDFIAAGGDGYSMLKDLPAYSTGSMIRDLLIDTIRRREIVEARVEGRIVRK